MHNMLLVERKITSPLHWTNWWYVIHMFRIHTYNLQFVISLTHWFLISLKLLNTFFLMSTIELPHYTRKIEDHSQIHDTIIIGTYNLCMYCISFMWPTQKDFFWFWIIKTKCTKQLLASNNLNVFIKNIELH